MRGSIIASSIIELVIAGMVILIGSFLVSNLFGGFIDSEDDNIFTVRDLSFFTDSVKKDNCAELEFFLDKGYKIEHLSNKLNLIKDGTEKPITSVDMKRNIIVKDNDFFNTIQGELPINIDFSKEIDSRACICNDDGNIVLSKMPYQYGIASGCSITEVIF